MTRSLTESTLESVVLQWFHELGYSVLHGPEIAPGELLAERNDYREVVLEQRLKAVLAQLNPKIPPNALDGRGD